MKLFEDTKSQDKIDAFMDAIELSSKDSEEAELFLIRFKEILKDAKIPETDSEPFIYLLAKAYDEDLSENEASQLVSYIDMMNSKKKGIQKESYRSVYQLSESLLLGLLTLGAYFLYKKFISKAASADEDDYEKIRTVVRDNPKAVHKEAKDFEDEDDNEVDDEDSEDEAPKKKKGKVIDITDKLATAKSESEKKKEADDNDLTPGSVKKVGNKWLSMDKSGRVKLSKSQQQAQNHSEKKSLKHKLSDKLHDIIKTPIDKISKKLDQAQEKLKSVADKIDKSKAEFPVEKKKPSEKATKDEAPKEDKPSEKEAPQAGDVEQTRTGNFKAIDDEGKPHYGFDSKKSAQNYLNNAAS